MPAVDLIFFLTPIVKYLSHRLEQILQITLAMPRVLVFSYFQHTGRTAHAALIDPPKVGFMGWAIMCAHTYRERRKR